MTKRRSDFYEKNNIFFVFCLLISCSDNKVDKISVPMWSEPLDASVWIDVQGETTQKTVYFKINGIQYSVFLWFEENYSEVEPVIVDIRGYNNDSDNKEEYFNMRMENYHERYFENIIIHKDTGFISLFDKKNNTLKYKQFPNNNYQDQIAVTDENGTLLFVYPEWELEDDWEIEVYN